MPSRSLTLSALQRIDEVCDEFEAAWQGGMKPRIEDFLAKTDFSQPTELFKELLAREVELRKKAGDLPVPADYVDRFGDYGDLIWTVFNDPQRDGDTALQPMSMTEAGTMAVSGEVGPSTLPDTTDAVPRTWDPGREWRSVPIVIPEKIGRFRPTSLLGQGNFLVFLARDEEHGRDVAIKIARPDNAFSRKRLMSLAEEAHRLANLDHPGIVKVYEFVPPAEARPDGEEAEPGFLVLECIHGPTLEQLFRSDRPAPGPLAEIMARVADAVHHAHLAGLIHRDLKPSNILIDDRGLPKVCDFGLALDEEVQRLRRGEVAGTLPYMAPEQVRGETNHLDGRTDIWALGVILYKGLTGQLPFRGHTTAAYFDEILCRDPRPPRQCARGIPRELERICLRCLSRQSSDRYLTAEDLAEDLRRWLSGASDGVRPATHEPVRPKGLRAYTASDANSFLALVPGPRDRDGLPESIKFWKMRIEDRDGEWSFSVGVIYGPSGAGKSSFVRAGVLPQVDRELVRPVYVETTPQGTEARLLTELRRLVPALPHEGDLADAVAMLRDNRRIRPREKLLLVFDQFEQWLQVNSLAQNSELVRALRQCDGKRISALLLVRDDFWMATSRLLKAVEVSLLEGSNAAVVEIPDARHTRDVLAEFGRSLGRIAPGDGPEAAEAEAFLDRAVAELADPDGRVMPVRVSLLVEVVRQRPWTASTLAALGGARGIHKKFLEEAFEPASAPARRRYHRRAAEAVLKALLPPPPSQLRGTPRSSGALLEAAGYEGRPGDFDDLIDMLDRDLRLITAIDPERLSALESQEFQAGSNPTSEVHYQLAHDYLIPPIRQWLERKEQATPPGRSRLRLALITSAWTDSPDSHHLPSLLELVGIVWHTGPREWSGDQRRMLVASARYYLRRAVTALILLGFLAFALSAYGDRRRAWSKLNEVLSADARKLPDLLKEMKPYLHVVRDELKRIERREDDSIERRTANLLLYRDEPTATRSRYLRVRLLDAEPDDLDVIRKTLLIHPDSAGIEDLWSIVESRDSSVDQRLRAAAALALLDPENSKWSSVETSVVRALLAQDRRSIASWVESLDPILRRLLESLSRVVADSKLHPSTREAAAAALAVALVRCHDIAGFAGPLADAPPIAFHILIQALQLVGANDEAIEGLTRILGASTGVSSPLVGDPSPERRANAAVALMILRRPEAVWPLLRHHEDSGPRALLIDRMARLGVDPGILVDRLQEGIADSTEAQAILMVLSEMIALAEPESPILSGSRTDDLVRIVQELYQAHPHPGVHSAAGQLLRRLEPASRVPEADHGEKPNIEPPAARNWFLGPNRHTFAVIGPLEGWVGSPPGEPGRMPNEVRQFVRTGRILAVAVTEVTEAQLRVFLKEEKISQDRLEGDEFPASRITWYLAARYCNWLSKKAGLPASEWCYPEPIQAGMRLDAGAVHRTGFRLPTEVEWELFCRAGSTSARPSGSSLEILSRYAITWLNADETLSEVATKLPNEYGLFDVLGNVWEWCHDGPDSDEHLPPYPVGTPSFPGLDSQRDESILEKGNPAGEEKQTFRYMRGGAYDYSPTIWARSSARYYGRVQRGKDERYKGFRVVRTLGNM